MDAWTDLFLDKAVRQEHDFPAELIFYRVVALTGWTEDEYRAHSQATINDLYTMDEIVRTNDRMVLAKMVAGQLAAVLAPMFGAKLT